MADYATEEEQLEALKRWWQENGRAVILGIALGVLALAGWRGWEMYSAQRALGASAVYDQLLDGLDADDYAAVTDRAGTLRADYAGTSYAVLGTLTAAGMAVGQGEFESAQEWLRWVLDNAGNPDFAALARARLARVLRARGKPDQALGLLDAEVPAAYAALYAETRGDVLRAQGDDQGAAAAYQRALDAEVGPANRTLVERKLNRVRDAMPAGKADEATGSNS